MPGISFLILFYFSLLYSCGPAAGTTEKFVWTEGPSPTYTYAYHVALSDQQKVYVLGGNAEGTMEVFDTQTCKWSDLAPMLTPRLFAAAVISGKYIYSMGGIDNSGQYSDVVEKYDMELHHWSSGTPLTSPRCRFAAVVHGDKIFVLGGLGGENDRSFVNLSLVEYYEPEQNRWTTAQSMSVAKHGHAAIINNDHIMVAGGYTDSGVTADVYQYHFTTQTWMILQDMPTPRGFFGIANINQMVYAIGGRVKEKFAPVERYHPAKNEWASMSPIAAWRNRFGMTSIGNTIYIMGGEEQPTNFMIGKLQQE